MSEFTNKTKKELAKLLSDKQKALQTFRFDISGSKVKNVKQARTLRKEVAQIMTEMNASSSHA